MTWTDPDRAEERRRMVARIVALARLTAEDTGREAFSARVLAALEAVPRHRFVRPAEDALAYEDTALPIGHGQTISQPYIVALMTDLLALSPEDRVLEIGTGSGYQAAVLSRLAGQVFTVEIVPEVAERAAQALRELGCANVWTRTGDGHAGWPEEAPFDAVLLTAATPRLPPALLDQLRPGGRLVLPLGEPWGEQELIVLEKGPDGVLASRPVIPVRFVPMTGAPS